MARPKFTPDAQQQRLLAALARVAERRDKLTAETDQLIAQATEAQVPVSAVAEALRVQRKTVYRHLGYKMQ